MSKITLEPNSSGAGTFSIVSPDSNTNRTLNLPDESGILFSDGSGVPGSAVTGQLTSSNMPAGSVIQVVSDSFTGVESTSVQAFDNNFADTSLSVSITPISTSSKIVVTAMVNTGSSKNSDGCCILRMTRNGNAVAIGDGSGSRIRATTGRGNESAGPNTQLTKTIHFIDEPSSTSAVNYTVQFAVRGINPGTAHINRTHNNNNSGQDHRTASFITAMEIAG